MQTTIENYVGKIPFDRFQIASQAARDEGHKDWIGDIPVHFELLKFFKAFKAKRYNVVPCVDKGTHPIWVKDEFGANKPIHIFHVLGITFPDAVDFRSGKIFVTNDGSSVVYCVESDKIENEKFSVSSDGYRIRQSKDMAKAVKVALKVLTTLDHDDIEERCGANLRQAVYSLNNEAQEKLYDKLSIPRDDLAQEVAHMVACGYAPSTLAFQKALDLIATEGAELRRMQSYKPRACFVWVKPNSLSYKFKEDSRAVECTQMDDVPELIRNKLAVLQIANNGDVIADVGIRVSDITYWVFA